LVECLKMIQRQEIECKQEVLQLLNWSKLSRIHPRDTYEGKKKKASKSMAEEKTRGAVVEERLDGGPVLHRKSIELKKRRVEAERRKKRGGGTACGVRGRKGRGQGRKCVIHISSVSFSAKSISTVRFREIF
jgi:hypothetical protein